MAMQSIGAGRPVVEETNDSFNLLCGWLETETEPYSMNEFYEKKR